MSEVVRRIQIVDRAQKPTGIATTRYPFLMVQIADLSGKLFEPVDIMTYTPETKVALAGKNIHGEMQLKDKILDCEQKFPNPPITLHAFESWGWPIT